VTIAGDTTRSSMPAGPWLNGPGGRPTGGALGVLIDNVLGLALMANCPADQWSVSAEISLDLCQPIPLDGTELSARARADHCDTSGGLSSGEVLDQRGRLVALCTQHARWVSIASALPPAPEVTSRQATGPPADLAGLLGARTHITDGGAQADLAVTRDLVNPLGNLHGGIALCLCDLMAQVAITASGGPLDTASVRVAYTRPLPLDTTARFDCRVVHCGRSFAVAQVTAVNENGKPGLIATVTTAQGQGKPR
jgi:uncharacterized protein (TIGR00369 family)